MVSLSAHAINNTMAEEMLCYVCGATGSPTATLTLLGCRCAGKRVHVHCMYESALSDGISSQLWLQCSVCTQMYTGKLQSEMASKRWAIVETYRAASPDRLDAACALCRNPDRACVDVPSHRAIAIMQSLVDVHDKQGDVCHPLAIKARRGLARALLGGTNADQQKAVGILRMQYLDLKKLDQTSDLCRIANGCLADALTKAGMYKDAEPANRQSVADALATFGNESRATFSAINNLGVTLCKLKKYKEGVPMLQKLLASATAADGPDAWNTLMFGISVIYNVFISQKKWRGAEAAIKPIIEVSRARYGVDSSIAISATYTYASILIGWTTQDNTPHRQSELTAAYESLHQSFVRVRPKESEQYANILITRYCEFAEVWIDKALQLSRDTFGPYTNMLTEVKAKLTDRKRKRDAP